MVANLPHTQSTVHDINTVEAKYLNLQSDILQKCTVAELHSSYSEIFREATKAGLP